MANEWIDAPMDREKLEALRVRLRRLRDAKLQREYEAALHMCRLDRGAPPRATFIQQLVQVWKDLERRRKAQP